MTRLSAFIFFICVAAFGATSPEDEQRIINGVPAGDGQTVADKRCEPEPEKSYCDEEREFWRSEGCISDWAAGELAKKGDNGGYPVCRGAKKKLSTWCLCGCFHPETRILVNDNRHNKIVYVTAQEVYENESIYELVVLDRQSNLQKIDLVTASIIRRTSGPERDPLVLIEFENDAALKLSSQHAVLLASGQMARADELQVGQYCVDRNGHQVKIREIRREMFEGEVINFFAGVEGVNGHMIIAEDMIVGDLAWQNELVSLLDWAVIK